MQKSGYGFSKNPKVHKSTAPFTYVIKLLLALFPASKSHKARMALCLETSFTQFCTENGLLYVMQQCRLAIGSPVIPSVGYLSFLHSKEKW